MKHNSVQSKNLILILAAAVCLTLLFAWWNGKSPERLAREGRKESAPLIRAETEVLAPNIVLIDGDGRRVKLRTLYNDRPVCLYFWHPWNANTADGLDMLQEFRDTWGDGVYVCAVTLTGRREEADRFIAKKGYTFLTYTADAGVLREYAVKELPVWIMIDKGGRILDKSEHMTLRQGLYDFSK